MITVIVTLGGQVDLRRFSTSGRVSRAAGVVRALQARASTTQKDVASWLLQRREDGHVGDVTSFWIFNGLAVTATPDVIYALAARPEVLTVTPNEIIRAPAMSSKEAPPEPNLSLIRAPDLWNLGMRGEGVVVASMDTGVDVSHPDLAGQWRGGANSWFDPHGEHPAIPTDRNGHGTATMSVVIGSDEGGTVIGVAPEAQWIAVKLFDDHDEATLVDVHLGFQWLLDPDGNPHTPDAPDVVNNSWSFEGPGCRLDFQQDLEALRAAGILPVFAAGNYGPLEATSASPANYPGAFSVGAVDLDDQILIDSSRGPSACGEDGTIFPEIVAPGVAIRTADLLGGYTIETGTSAAAPHATGAVALLLGAYPDLSLDCQERALLNGALDLGLFGPDNDYGYGRLDVFSSYLWLNDQRRNHIYLPVVSLDAPF
jgi:subtilisin family serine protease